MGLENVPKFKPGGLADRLEEIKSKEQKQKAYQEALNNAGLGPKTELALRQPAKMSEFYRRIKEEAKTERNNKEESA